MAHRYRTGSSLSPFLIPKAPHCRKHYYSLPFHEFSNLPIDLELSASHFASIEVAASAAQVRWHRRGDHHETELADCRSVNHLYGTNTNPTSCSCASGCDRFYSEDDSVLLHAGL